MKKINTRFIAEEAVPELLTIGMIPFCMLAYFCEWVHGVIDTALCAVVFLLCVWSTGYREWEEVKNKISKLHYGIFAFCFLFMIALGTKLYSMTEIVSSSKLLILTIAIVSCLLIGVGYNKTICRAEKYEEKDREHRIAMAGYHALWTVAIFILVYSAFFWAIYYFGDALSDFIGVSRLATWQTAMHNMF